MNAREKLKPSKRKIIQLYCALLYNAYIKGFIKGEIYTGKAKYACVPGLNCYSCPGAVSSCPLGSLQAALAGTHDRIGFYIFGILLLYGIIAGRTVCGWLCPFGLLQELLHKIPTPKLKKNKATRILSYLKYVILAVFAVILPLAYGLAKDMSLPGFCKYICPAGTLEGAVGLLINPSNKFLFGALGGTFRLKITILILCILTCIFVYRAFCRFICPLGAIYGLFNRFCFIGVRTDESACNHCGLCVKKCETDILHVSDRECIQCGKCIDVCAQGALSLKAGKIVLKANEIAESPLPENERVSNNKKRKLFSVIAMVVAAAVLIFVFVCVNFSNPNPVSPENAGQSVGYEPGMQLEDFSIECLDGSTFRLEENRGKTVIINLWATYCGPCVEEMPYFCDIADRYDDVTVIAIHHPLTVTDVDAFVSEKGWNIPVAVDKEGPASVWDKVGGTTVMPQTIVLDKDGIVVENHVGNVTPEMLEKYCEP